MTVITPPGHVRCKESDLWGQTGFPFLFTLPTHTDTCKAPTSHRNQTGRFHGEFFLSIYKEFQSLESMKSLQAPRVTRPLLRGLTWHQELLSLFPAVAVALPTRHLPIPSASEI